MSTKSKSSFCETPNSKATPPTPRVRATRGAAKPDHNSPRLSIDRSPRSVTSKPIQGRSPKLTTPPDKPSRLVKGSEVHSQARTVRGSEIQSQLILVQEDLNKAKDQLALIETEKEKAINELKEANEKLREALVAQKRAQDDSEIDKFRAVELEHAGADAVRSQHAQELAMTCDATKIHAEKVEIVTNELTRSKGFLDSELEKESTENCKLVQKIDSLKQELEKAKGFEEKLMVMEASLKQELAKTKSLEEKLVEKEASLQQEHEKAQCLEEKLVGQEASLKQELEKTKSLEEELEEKEASLKQEVEKSRGLEEELEEKEAAIEELNVELEAAKEWKSRVQELEMQMEEANKLERCSSESLESIMKQLQGNHDSLHDAESEIASLKEKVGLLQMTIRRQRRDLEEAERRVNKTNEEAMEMEASIESLKSELETVKEEKAEALNNENLAASSIQSLLEEKNKLMTRLESSKEEEENSKKAMESLASALHEVSAEAREAKEKLLSSQDEHDNHEAEIENLRLILEGTNKKYEIMLDDARHEIYLLADTIERSKHEWEQKELHLVSCVNQSQEENASLEKEMNRVLSLLKESKEEGDELKYNLKEVEAEVIYLQETLGEAKAESMKMKESLLDKENELHGVVQENDELRTRDATSVKKTEELSKLLEEAMARKQTEENGEVTDSDKDYDLLPKVGEFYEENGHGGEDKLEKTKGDLVEEVESKMWQSCKIEKEQSLNQEPEHEPFEADELDSKMEGGESFDQINGLSSTEKIDDDDGTLPSKQQLQLQKKKKPLLGKFGNLLKKKSTGNQR